MVFKKITLIGTSAESFEEAIEDAISAAEETGESVYWVDVVSQGVEVASVDGREYQAEVEVALEASEV